MSFDYSGTLKLKDIKVKAKDLAKKLKYKFNKISYLCTALYCQKISETNNKYTNSAIALIGDNVLKLSLSHKFYVEKADKEFINNKKADYEKNEKLKKVCDKLEIYRYAFNNDDFYSENLPDHKKLPHPEHDPYVEAVIGAIYLDKGFKYANEWINKQLIPRIEESL